MNNVTRSTSFLENKGQIRSVATNGRKRPAGTKAASWTGASARAQRPLPVLATKSSINGIQWLSFALVADIVRSNWGASAQEVVDLLYQEVINFSERDTFDYDLTIMVLRTCNKPPTPAA